MNKGSKLPEDNHVVRHIPYKKLIKDENDKVIGFFAEAFKPRPSDNKDLSVNRIEYFVSDDHTSSVHLSVQHLRSQRNISKNSAFGIGNVGNIKKLCQEHGSPVRIVFIGDDGNPSHSLIRDITPEDDSLLDILATNAFELIRNQDI